MKLGLTDIQYNSLLTVLQEQGETPAAEPEKGTSDKQSGGQGYPAVGKWESGITRGSGNQIGVTKWADVVGSKLTRGKANPLKEQSSKFKLPLNPIEFNKRYPKQGSDYLASVDRENRIKIDILTGKIKIKKHIYKANDGDNLFMNLIKGEFSEALLDLREVTFTPGGMVTQTVVEVIFSETVVVPIAIESLNAAILLNDIDLYFEQGSRDPEALWRVIGDLVLLATRGLFKFSGKKLKAWAQSPAGKEYIQNMMSKLSSFNTTIQKSIEKLPSGKLKNYALSRLSNLQLLKNILNKGLKTSSNIIAKTPKKFRKAVVAGLLTYITAEGLDRLLNKKVGTTRQEMASLEGVSDETMAELEQYKKATGGEIKTADDLDILIKKKDLKTFTIETIKLYKDSYPCLGDLYQKNQFIVVTNTGKKDIFKINNEEYYEEGYGIINTITGQELEC